jgi:hypothetical protein
MNDGIKILVEYIDEDLLELFIAGSNGLFSGSVNVYESHDALTRLSNAIRGFPVSISDIRNVELGTFIDTSASGGIQMEFQCRDSLGHLVVELFMRDSQGIQYGMARFSILVDPAGIDDFVAQLDKIKIEVGSYACLRRVT